MGFFWCVLCVGFFVCLFRVGVESVITCKIQNGLSKRISESFPPGLSVSLSVAFSLAFVLDLMGLYVCFDSVRRF